MRAALGSQYHTDEVVVLNADFASSRKISSPPRVAGESSRQVGPCVLEIAKYAGIKNLSHP